MDFKEMFERADIKNIEKFVLNNGHELLENTAESYTKRISAALSEASEFLEQLPDSVDPDEAWEHITILAATFREIYFEVGMKVGAKIGYQLHNEKIELPE